MRRRLRTIESPSKGKDKTTNDDKKIDEDRAIMQQMQEEKSWLISAWFGVCFLLFFWYGKEGAVFLVPFFLSLMMTYACDMAQLRDGVFLGILISSVVMIVSLWWRYAVHSSHDLHHHHHHVFFKSNTAFIIITIMETIFIIISFIWTVLQFSTGSQQLMSFLPFMTYLYVLTVTFAPLVATPLVFIYFPPASSDDNSLIYICKAVYFPIFLMGQLYIVLPNISWLLFNVEGSNQTIKKFRNIFITKLDKNLDKITLGREVSMFRKIIALAQESGGETCVLVHFVIFIGGQVLPEVFALHDDFYHDTHGENVTIILCSVIFRILLVVVTLIHFIHSSLLECCKVLVNYEFLEKRNVIVVKSFGEKVRHQKARYRSILIFMILVVAITVTLYLFTYDFTNTFVQILAWVLSMTKQVIFSMPHQVILYSATFIRNTIAWIESMHGVCFLLAITMVFGYARSKAVVWLFGGTIVGGLGVSFLILSCFSDTELFMTHAHKVVTLATLLFHACSVLHAYAFTHLIGPLWLSSKHFLKPQKILNSLSSSYGLLTCAQISSLSLVWGVVEGVTKSKTNTRNTMKVFSTIVEEKRLLMFMWLFLLYAFIHVVIIFALRTQIEKQKRKQGNLYLLLPSGFLERLLDTSSILLFLMSFIATECYLHMMGHGFVHHLSGFALLVNSLLLSTGSMENGIRNGSWMSRMHRTLGISFVGLILQCCRKLFLNDVIHWIWYHVFSTHAVSNTHLHELRKMHYWSISHSASSISFLGADSVHHWWKPTLETTFLLGCLPKSIEVCLVCVRGDRLTRTSMYGMTDIVWMLLTLIFAHIYDSKLIAILHLVLAISLFFIKQNKRSKSVRRL